MISGLGLFTELAFTGAVLYLIHDIMVKTNIFLISGLIYKIKGTVDIKELGGMYTGYPKLSLLIAVILFMLAGIPPLSGFWPKIVLYQAALTAQVYWLLAVILFAGFVTLYVIGKIWVEVFWKPQPSEDTVPVDSFAGMDVFRRSLLVAPVVMMACVSLYIGFCAEHVMLLAEHIAKELINPAAYIQAVLAETTIR
jgi:multicomponent Na+:H+ antiporter subunit D